MTVSCTPNIEFIARSGNLIEVINYTDINRMFIVKSTNENKKVVYEAWKKEDLIKLVDYTAAQLKNNIEFWTKENE
jgi:hypothetical protein